MAISQSNFLANLASSNGNKPAACHLRVYLDGKACTIEDLAQTKQTGIQSQKETVLFLHGWPDNHALWAKQVEDLKHKYRCITVDLPNVGVSDAEVKAYREGKQGRGSNRYLPWGVDFEQMVEVLRELIDSIQQKGEPVILVTHDWGAVYGYLLESKHPQLIRRMISMDVGASMKFGFTALLFVLAYQLLLAVAFILYTPVGDVVAKFVARIFSAPTQLSEIGGRLCYPYFYFWKATFTGKVILQRRHMPSCPLLFLYASHSPIFFHSSGWRKAVDARPGSRCIAMPTDHWVMAREPDMVNSTIKKWLKDQL